MCVRYSCVRIECVARYGTGAEGHPKPSTQAAPICSPCQWPHVLHYETPDDLLASARALMANATWRHEISRAQKAFFRRCEYRRRGEGAEERAQ